jgi:hypothetical protein
MLVGAIYRIYPHQPDTGHTVDIVFILLVAAPFLLCVRRLGRVYGGRITTGAWLFVWYSMMWIGFFGSIVLPVVVLASLWHGNEVAPVRLLQIAVAAGLWWFGRRRFLSLTSGGTNTDMPLLP